jgi:hypothetical protein
LNPIDSESRIAEVSTIFSFFAFFIENPYGYDFFSLWCEEMLRLANPGLMHRLLFWADFAPSTLLVAVVLGALFRIPVKARM